MQAEYWVKVERLVNAGVDQVYAAWTEPDLMQQWMGGEVEADARVGGTYRIRLRGEDNQPVVHSGEYRVLEPGRRIVQTFRAGTAELLPEGMPYTDEFLEITLSPVGPAQTLVHLLDGWRGEDMGDDAREAVRQSWLGWIAQLDRVF